MNFLYSTVVSVGPVALLLTLILLPIYFLSWRSAPKPKKHLPTKVFMQPLASVVLFAALMVTTAAYAQSGLVVAPNESVGGIRQAEWSRLWWQWAGSFQGSESPVADQTGDFCGSKQGGPVWFLAGTYATRRTIRACTVPKDKYLFFPLINYVVMPPVNDSTTCSSVTKNAAAMTDDPASLILEIDGKRIGGLSAHRLATTQCFDMGAKTREQVRVFPSAANGYYVMLRPLPPGKHELNFGGALPSMLQAVTYTLQVE
jgi:hypothetical protein